MNEGLFEKYKKVLTQKNNEKQEVIRLLQEISGIVFKEDEIVIEKKSIYFHTSSVKKSILLQKSIQSQLIEKGYRIKI
jgi:lactam utilization protein B